MTKCSGYTVKGSYYGIFVFRNTKTLHAIQFLGELALYTILCIIRHFIQMYYRKNHTNKTNEQQIVVYTVHACILHKYLRDNGSY